MRLRISSSKQRPMAHGGCFGDHLEGVVSLQNQSRAYNVQACENIDIVAALWATERQIKFNQRGV